MDSKIKWPRPDPRQNHRRSVHKHREIVRNTHTENAGEIEVVELTLCLKLASATLALGRMKLGGCYYQDRHLLIYAAGSVR